MQKHILFLILLGFSCLFATAQDSAPPTLTADSDATVDGNIEIAFPDDVDWRGAIDTIYYNGVVLANNAWSVGVGQLTLNPANDATLQQVGDFPVRVQAPGYSEATVTQSVAHGAPFQLDVSGQPGAPDVNGGVLNPQPQVTIQDKYSNVCTSNTSEMKASRGDEGNWTLGGTTSKSPSNGVVDYTDLTASSTEAVTGAFLTFTVGGVTGNSDAFDIAELKDPPTLLTIEGTNVDDIIEIRFSENNDWQSNIKAVFYGDTQLAEAAYDKNQVEKILLDPSKDNALQVAGTKQFKVEADGYKDATVNLEIGHGAPKSLFIVTQPGAPANNGEELQPQPKISVQDQYGNDCISNSVIEITAAKGDDGDWTLGGTTSGIVTDGVFTFSDLTASSEEAISGAQINFTAQDLTSVLSEAFDIADRQSAPSLTAASDATVDASFDVGYSPTDVTWRDKIYLITVDGDTLAKAAWQTSDDPILRFSPAEDTLIQKVGDHAIVVKSTGYNDASVTQQLKHGAPRYLEVTVQPEGPAYNGDPLSVQPQVQIVDQYRNICDSDSESNVVVEKGDDLNWTLEGTLQRTSSDGVVAYDDLKASSEEVIENAILRFKLTDVDEVLSEGFDIKDLTDPPDLTSASSATVDDLFEITFTDDKDWRNRITQILWGENELFGESYDTTQVGKIVFDPSKSEFLQSPGNYQVVISADGYRKDTVQQGLLHGASMKLSIEVQPQGPDINGGIFKESPVIALSDQYDNPCDGDSATVVVASKDDELSWELSGTLQVKAMLGKVTYNELQATSETSIEGARLKFLFDQDTVISEGFDIVAPLIELSADESATVDDPFIVTFEDNASWRDSITAISYGDTQLADTAYVVGEGSITFDPSKSVAIQVAGEDSVKVEASGYVTSRVLQKIAHGKTTRMDVAVQPVGPEVNGDTLIQQPQLQLYDQYDNFCTTDDITKGVVSNYDNDVDHLWVLGGTTDVVAIDGVIKYLNLTATSENEVVGAQLLFQVDGIQQVVSDTFSIVIPPPPVVTAALDASVDNSFEVTFEDNETWRSLIKQILYGAKSLGDSYDASQPGKIVFDPQILSPFQQAAADSIYIISGKYDTVRFKQPIAHGVAKYLVITKQPSSPENNGEVLFRQPQLQLQDQYRNSCDTDMETAVRVKKGDEQSWSLGGDLMVVAKNGLVEFLDLTASSSYEVQNAILEFYGTGIIPEKSLGFTIPEPRSQRAGTARANPEVVCYGDKSRITLNDYEGSVQWQILDDNTQNYINIEGEVSELFVTDALTAPARYRARVDLEGYPSQYSNVVVVSVNEPPVADFNFDVVSNVVNFKNLSENAASVVWDFGDGSHSVEYDPVHSYFLDQMTGNGFEVVLTASNQGCPDSEQMRLVTFVTGIGDQPQLASLLIYPNPNKGLFTIRLEGASQKGVLRVIDVRGNVVFTRQLEVGISAIEIPMDLTHLSKGLYIIGLQYPDRIINTSIITQ